MGFDHQVGRPVATGVASGEVGPSAAGKQTLTQNMPSGTARAPTKRHLTSAPPAVRSPGLDGAGADPAYAQAENALFAMVEIFTDRDASQIDAACGPYVMPLRQIEQALTGKAGGRPLSDAARERLFAAGTRAMQRAIAALNTTPEGANWVAYTVHRSWFDETSYAFSAARERVRDAIVVGDHVVDVPPEDAPREQARALHDALRKLVPVMRDLNEQLVHYNEHAIEHEIEALLAHGKAHSARGRLTELADVLLLVDGWLALSDEELPQQLGEIHGVFDGVETYSELVKAIAELTGGAVGVTAKAVAIVATATGQAGMAATATALARNVGEKFGDIVASAEAIVGVAEILDPDTTPGEKLEGGIHAATGGGWIVGARTIGADATFSATVPVLLGYEEWKWAVTTYWESSIGIDSFLIEPAFEAITRIGSALAQSSNMLFRSAMIERDEIDPAARTILHDVTVDATKRVRSDIVSLLDACESPDISGGIANPPGAWPLFRALFAPLREYRHADTPERALDGATVALTKIAWANRHAPLIVEGSVKNDSLETVELDARRMDLLERWKSNE